MTRELPAGTVTFLFTDIEGSTGLLNELGAEAYSSALAEHRRVLRAAFVRHEGVEVDTQGDAFFVVFPSASGAVSAAAEAQDELAGGPIRVRMGLHTGTPHLGPEGYVGPDVHLGARIAAAAHGGQVLLSKQTRELADGEMSDLGEHRLKDFSAPVWIYQLGTEHFPPLMTISNTNLPRPASSFVGREREVKEVGELLSESGRLVSLTGPGGSGKSRLAIEAATELVPAFRNGVFWAGLSAVRDPALVTTAIGQTIGAKNGLAAHIGQREMLLVLDNLEQVVDAASELAALVETCPNMRLLVTSRERLRVRGEVEYPVPPLASPDAVQLFSQRSGLPADETIAELCRRLDNLPLAIELAAARASVLSPAQILARLSTRLDLLKGGRDADPRQQTLRATIEWSYDLLDALEQTLFARLAVFLGGCTLEAAEEVAGADLDTLQSLVDKSLVQSSGERFSMLETIREYAAERLAESGDAEVTTRRHADHFLRLAEEAEPTVLGLNPGDALDRLDQDHDNLRAALEWLSAAGQTQHALRLAGALWEFWCLRGHRNEGWRRLEGLLARDEGPTLARAKALTGSSHLATHAAGADAVQRRLRDEQALDLYRRLGDPWGIAYAEFQLASSFAIDGDFATALPLVEESVRRLREVGDEHRALQALRSVAWCNLELGGVERARPHYEALLEGARAAGDLQMEARALSTLASFASDEGRHREANTMLEEMYRIDADFGDPEQLIDDLIAFARALAFAGRAGDAVRLLSRAEAMREELGMAVASWVLEDRDAAETAARGRLDADAFAEAWDEGRRMALDRAVALALGEPSS